MNIKTIVGFSLILLGANPVLADSMRCGGNLVTTGDSTSKVLARCGEPTRRKVGCYAPLSAQNRLNEKNCNTHETWNYTGKPGDYDTELRFENDSLESIVLGRRR